jgi:DNA-binding NarL/FixJ family response regulator
MLFESIQDAAVQYESTPLVFRSARPALAARAAMQMDDKFLSCAEKQVLICLARGLRNKQIARHLGFAESTVKNRVSALYARMGASSRAELILTALSLGLLGESDVPTHAGRD